MLFELENTNYKILEAVTLIWRCQMFTLLKVIVAHLFQ